MPVPMFVSYYGETTQVSCTTRSALGNPLRNENFRLCFRPTFGRKERAMSEWQGVKMVNIDVGISSFARIRKWGVRVCDYGRDLPLP